MFLLALAAASVLLGFYVFGQLREWRRNYIAAKASGFHVYLVPFYPFELWWLVVNRPLLKRVRRLPKNLRPGWLERAQPAFNLYAQYGAFKDSDDVDTYMTCSPKGNTLYTANPELIAQIAARRTDFPKPWWVYRSLTIYGHNIVTAEGDNWRRHRKTAGPSFTEDSNRLMWTECIRQSQLLLRKWMGTNKDESSTITTLGPDCFRITLHIMAGAGFNIPLRWPGLEDEPEEPSERTGAKEPGPASITHEPHQLTQYEALRETIENFVWLLVLGPKLLSEFTSGNHLQQQLIDTRTPAFQEDPKHS